MLRVKKKKSKQFPDVQRPFRDKICGCMQLYLPFQNNKFDIHDPKTFFTSLGVEKQQEASSSVYYSQC